MTRLPSKYRSRSRSPPPSRVRRQSRSPPPSSVRRRSRSPPPSKYRRRSMSPSPSNVRRRSRSPPPSKSRRRYRSPPLYVSITRRPAELQRDRRPSFEAAVEGERAGPSSLDEPSVENRPSHSHRSYKAPSSGGARKVSGGVPLSKKISYSGESTVMLLQYRRELENSGCAKAQQAQRLAPPLAPSRNARRKRIRRQVLTEAKKQMREMKKDKLLEKIKKLQDYVWLLEKEGADMAEIVEFRSLLKSTKREYEKNEELLVQAGSSASPQVLNSDRLEKMHVETTAAPVEKVEGDKQNMDSGEVEGRSIEGGKAVSEQSELAEEVNRLKSEIETVRQDHDYQLAQAQSLMADVAKQKEVARMYGVELEDAMRRVAALEEEGMLQSETVRTLQLELASANEKLTVPSSSKE